MSQNIDVSIHYPVALPNLKAYEYLNLRKEDYNITNVFQNEILSLPMYQELSSEQIGFVANCIKDFFATQ